MDKSPLSAPRADTAPDTGDPLPDTGGRAPQPEPVLTVLPAMGDTTAVALVLHGGKARSRRPASRRQLSAVRMRPFAKGLHRAGAGAGLAVWSLGYRDRGWNDGLSQLADTRWALDRIAREHPQAAVFLVGHSLGGRVALAAGGDPRVRGIVALAPWLPDDEPVEHLGGAPVLMLHGTRDRWVPAAGSLAFARRARAAGVEVLRFEVGRAGHAMLRRSSLWHGLTTTFVLSRLGPDPASPAWGLRVPL